MDRIVLIAIAVAVIAVIGATLMLNPGGGTKTTPQVVTPVVQEAQEEPQVDDTQQSRQPRGNFTNATYGATVEEIATDCQLYQHVVTGRFYCFSKSGKYGVMVTNEYKQATSDQYFCKGTPYGCTLYETVYIQPP
jgi:hypothetical protein